MVEEASSEYTRCFCWPFHFYEGITIQTIIITDLDGTLLHPKTYSFEAARPALIHIKERRIPLILCSSKTRGEIELYRKWLENRHPFISENGGGIFIPRKYFEFPVKGELQKDYTTINLGMPYDKLRDVLMKIREGLGIKVRGFGDMNVKEVADLAGMSLFEAELAKKRDFDEPFVFEEGELRVEEFLKAVDTQRARRALRGRLHPALPVEGATQAPKIEEAGLHWTQGRFFHILGDSDKGKAIKILKDLYEKAYGKIKTIGLGDGLNDLPLLQEVDYPVLVQKEDGRYETRIDLPGLIRADGIGPEGWANAVMGLI
ncbi:MAG: HAD-IIB family hydrolase [Nitrospirota bacterium]